MFKFDKQAIDNLASYLKDIADVIDSIPDVREDGSLNLMKEYDSLWLMNSKLACVSELLGKARDANHKEAFIVSDIIKRVSDLVDLIFIEVEDDK